jgi:hypothetical protein
LEFDDGVRAAKGSVDISEREIRTECVVIRPIGVKSRRIGGEGSFWFDNHREFSMLDQYSSCLLLSCGTTRRENGDDTPANKTNAIDCQRGSSAVDARRPIAEEQGRVRANPRDRDRSAPSRIQELVSRGSNPRS